MSTVASATDTNILYEPEKPREPVQQLGKDEFIQLLLVQMQYQDPLEPMDTNESIAQLAQFSALEQMMNVASMTEKQMAYDMVGSYATYSYDNEETGQTEWHTGKIEFVKTNGEEIMLGFSTGHEVPLANVEEVINGTDITGDSSAFDVIGQTVQATYESKNEEGTIEQQLIEGEVLEVILEDGDAYVIIGTGKESMKIPFEDVQNIVENPSITGREVTYKAKDENGKEIEVTGVVEYITITEEDTYVYVNEEFIDFKDLISVKNKTEKE
ncbi:flagellar hook capping protein [Candidatus Epulonipiscium fishelsonii]|uniref:Flagellar hook capping protein n=1 Tax=Candidatus Epulonipiscium fishelsonii TaxID=77094 RepID=A0ACC8XDL6_9FIRM|nr:flagellar hook capping protein [Epulopiscium sp. SCG-B05WGA-EpuloA1]ONI40983.1 flagellar hook capping protein [Epulopiscium sp. SCG-B11WGA-EpuloA1]ONI47335.1 flagellar hook capping protein [Epulopiscium sp. SCG-C06WGA-EpuloA1]